MNSVIKKMENVNEDIYLTTDYGMTYKAVRVLGSKKYEMFTLHTEESLGIVDTMLDVIDAINVFEKVIINHICHLVLAQQSTLGEE